MPELPDIEVFRRYFDSTSLNKTIVKTEVPEPSILHDTTPQALGRAVVGEKFTKSRRIGKHMLVHTDDGKWLTLHFGMTGFLKYIKGGGNGTDHPAVIFHFDNGYGLIYDCTRKLGEVGLTTDPEKFADEKELGPDALDVDFDEFAERLSGRRGSVKSALMNQSAIAGIGNIYSDEILYATKIHPASSAKRLDREKLCRIYKSMDKILKKAIEVRVDKGEMPDDWLIHRRKPGEKCPCGGETERAKIAGRSSYFCPECQEKL